MAIYKGDKEVARMYHGTKDVTSIYKGSKLVWSAKKPWVEYADGVLTFHYDSLQKACANTNYDLNTNTTAPAWKAENAANVTKVVFDEAYSKARPTSCYHWFSGMKNLTDIEGLDYLNTSKVTRMDSMYEGCLKLSIDLDLSKQDWSSMKSLSSTFSNAKLKSLKVPPMNGNSIGMNYIFYNCSVNTLDLSMWNIYVNDWLAYVFQGCSVSSLKMFTASGFTYMAGFFGSCALERVDEEIAGKLDTSNVWMMGSIWSWNSALKYADISSWATPKVTSISNMFYSCKGLETAILPTFKAGAKLQSLATVFNICPKLTSVTLDFREGSCNNIVSAQGMFTQCTILPEIDLSEIDTSKVTNMSQMFYQCNALAHIYVSDLWDVSKVTESTDMFKDCESLPNYDATKIDVSMAKYDTDGGYLTFRRYFMINRERFYIYDRNLIYEGDLGFSDSDEYVCSFNFTLGANNTAVYQRYKAAGDPESIILPFSINTDDYTDVTFYDMDGNELVGETIDGGTEFGIEVSTGHTIVFQSEKGATIVKSSLVYPETISTMDLEDDEISDDVEAYEIPIIEKPEGWVD